MNQNVRINYVIQNIQIIMSFTVFCYWILVLFCLVV